jgi:mutator protein MutT
MPKQLIRVVGALLERPEEPGRYLITQRTEHACFPLLWEFPGGRALPDEPEPEALVRELRERLSVHAEVTGRAMVTEHEYDHCHVTLSVFFCRPAVPDLRISGEKVRDVRWVSLAEMSGYTFPPADEKALELLLGS